MRDLSQLAKGFALDIPLISEGFATQRERNSRFATHNGLRFFADGAAKKLPLRGS